MDLLADAFLAARATDPRLHLLLAWGGPEEAGLRAWLGDAATFLGWLDGEDLAVAYASADAFLFCSVTDTYGQVILEAGAAGLPVIAIAEGGPAALVENRHTGLLCRPRPLLGALDEPARGRLPLDPRPRPALPAHPQPPCRLTARPLQRSRTVRWTSARTSPLFVREGVHRTVPFAKQEQSPSTMFPWPSR